MDLLQLTYFCSAAKTQNFSKTAEAFFVPPSNVSQTIKRLEKELGTRLFHREPNKITLNETGRIFYANVSHALALIHEAKERAQASAHLPTGEIKILVHTCRRIVTQAVEAFKTKYPDVFFVIHHTSVGNGDYDFIISDEFFSPRLPQKSLLLSEPIMLACHAKHPLAIKEEIRASELLNEPFIAMSAGNSMHGVLSRICERENVKFKIAIQSDDPFYVRKYLDENLGIAFVPATSWRGTLSSNVVLKRFGAYTRETFVSYDESGFMPFIQKEFLSTLKSAFENQPPLG